MQHEDKRRSSQDILIKARAILGRLEIDFGGLQEIRLESTARWP